jgi:hypothetical protein
MNDHWLARPRTIRRLWQIFIAVLVLTVVIQSVVEVHPHFAVEGIFGFNAAYGFIACAALILVAKGIGLFVKRPDDYYRD